MCLWSSVFQKSSLIYKYLVLIFNVFYSVLRGTINTSLHSVFHSDFRYGAKTLIPTPKTLILLKTLIPTPKTLIPTHSPASLTQFIGTQNPNSLTNYPPVPQP